MRLRAPKVRPSVALQYCSVTYEIGAAMRYPGSRTLLASLSGLVLILAASEAFAAGPGAAHRGGLAPHPAFRPGIGRSFGHHRGRNVGAFWPGGGDWVSGSTPGEPGVDVPPPTSGDVHYTYTYDVPWDAVHRFPPNVVPSARPYVPDCTAQTVRVPRREGGEQTASVNIMRCY
jgi:hypothetical protein